MEFIDRLFELVKEYPRDLMDENGIIRNDVAYSGMLFDMIEVMGSITYLFARETKSADVRAELYSRIRGCFNQELENVEKIVIKKQKDAK